MEPLTIATGIFGVASIAFQIGDSIGKLLGFLEAVKDAPEDIERINADLNLLLMWVEAIADLYEKRPCGPGSLGEVAAIKTLKRCLDSIQRMSDIVAPVRLGSSKAEKIRHRTTLKVALRKKKVKKILNDLRDDKLLLNLAQTYYQTVSNILLSELWSIS